MKQELKVKYEDDYDVYLVTNVLFYPFSCLMREDRRFYPSEKPSKSPKNCSLGFVVDGGNGSAERKRYRYKIAF